MPLRTADSLVLIREELCGAILHTDQRENKEKSRPRAQKITNRQDIAV
jgi:hypothetical protein